MMTGIDINIIVVITLLMWILLQWLYGQTVYDYIW